MTNLGSISETLLNHFDIEEKICKFADHYLTGQVFDSSSYFCHHKDCFQIHQTLSAWCLSFDIYLRFCPNVRLLQEQCLSDVRLLLITVRLVDKSLFHLLKKIISRGRLSPKTHHLLLLRWLLMALWTGRRKEQRTIITHAC